MTVNETVADIVRRVEGMGPYIPSEWVDREGEVAWIDENGSDRLFIGRVAWTRVHTAEEWLTHPAAFVLWGEPRSVLEPQAEVAFATWAMDPRALDAVLAADVDPDYARTAHRSGITDARALIDCWTSGVPLEYLAAMGAAS